MTEPRIQYAQTSDGVSIAYAIAGSGRPLVGIPIPGFSHVELQWETFGIVWKPLAQAFRVAHVDAADVRVDGVARHLFLSIVGGEVGHEPAQADVLHAGSSPADLVAEPGDPGDERGPLGLELAQRCVGCTGVGDRSPQDARDEDHDRRQATRDYGDGGGMSGGSH